MGEKKSKKQKHGGDYEDFCAPISHMYINCLPIYADSQIM